MPTPADPDRRRAARALTVAAVAGAHLALFAFVGGATPEAERADDPPIHIELTHPPEPVPFSPDPEETAGGGAPAAASRVHAPPIAQPPPEPAPFTPDAAPEPEIVVGAATEATDTPDVGQGGQGSGQGGGVGSGVGPGRGVERARLISAPDGRQLAALHPDGPNARRPGRAAATCRVRVDTRLEACRVTEETPAGHGFGQAAVAAAALYRFRPYMRDGRPESGEIVIVVEFGRPR